MPGIPLSLLLKTAVEYVPVSFKDLELVRDLWSLVYYFIHQRTSDVRLLFQIIHGAVETNRKTLLGKNTILKGIACVSADGSSI